MNAAIPAFAPTGAALWHGWTRTFMDVILHLGAHRTATTTFQHYVRDHLEVLSTGGKESKVKKKEKKRRTSIVKGNKQEEENTRSKSIN